MNLKDYQALKGKIVRFAEGVDDCETGFEPGMMGVVCEVDLDEDDMVKVTVDFSRFEEYNKGFMTPNYYSDTDKTKADLKWCESAYYPKNKRDTLYLTLGEPPAGSLNYFQVVGDASDVVVVVTREKAAEICELAKSVSPANEMAMDNNAVQLSALVLKLFKCP